MPSLQHLGSNLLIGTQTHQLDRFFLLNIELSQNTRGKEKLVMLFTFEHFVCVFTVVTNILYRSFS